MAKSGRIRLDEADLSIIKELHRDGRRGVAEIADTLGIHRNTVSMKLKRLIDKRVVNPSIYVNPPALGFKAAAVIGVKVAPGEIDPVVALIEALPNVHNVFVCLGRYDIVLWGLFRDQDELHSFITKELGKAPGIVGAETMITLGMKKLSFTFLESPFVQQGNIGGRTTEVASASEVPADGAGLDDQDRAIIRELQRDARQSAAAIARSIGVNKNTVSTKLRSLLDEGTVKAFVAPNAIALGYHVMVAVGISVLPGEIEAASDRLAHLDSTQTLIICTGRYNIMYWGLFRDMEELYELLRSELGKTPGIRDAETMVILQVAKNSFAYLTPP
jgi:Lrp/AsnC family transcriptional regulator for asnA, asnC and gidA